MNFIWTLDGWIIVTGVLSACSCALLGNYLLLRRMSLMGDAISHAVLPGLALSFLWTHSRSSVPMFVGAALSGLLAAILTQMIARHGKVEHGAAMGVVFSILFAIGLILIRTAADHVDLDPGCVLYGNVEFAALDTLELAGWQISRPALILAGVMLLNLLFVVLFYRELKITSFDPALATTLGINAGWMHYALMALVAVTTVANFESVGSILVIAMLIVPPATAYLLTNRLLVMLVLSMVVAVVAAVGGHLLAIWGPQWLGDYKSVSTAAMIAVTAGALFFVAVIAAPEYGVLGKLVQSWRLALQIAREDILGILYRWREMNPDEDAHLAKDQIFQAVGHSPSVRLAFRLLCYRKQIELAADGTVLLRTSGATAGKDVIRSHRLWESYLAKHFNLPLSHLHEPAERLEHFIDEAMRQELGEDLTGPTHDPHGAQIPASDE